MTPPVDMITSDGYDLQFGVNVLGIWLYLLMRWKAHYIRVQDISTSPSCSYLL